VFGRAQDLEILLAAGGAHDPFLQPESLRTQSDGKEALGPGIEQDRPRPPGNPDGGDHNAARAPIDGLDAKLVFRTRARDS